MQPRSWKTTSLGIVTITIAVLGAASTLLQGGHVDYNAVVTSILAGWGLIHAADNSNLAK